MSKPAASHRNHGRARALLPAMALLLMLITGCVGPRALLRGPVAVRNGVWVDTARGEPLPFDALLDDLTSARIIYLGERHGVARHHRQQQRIIAGLAGRGVPLALGLEQLEAQYQSVLDRYARGEIDFRTLATETDWATRWRNYGDYRPAIEAARKAGAPLLALNGRRETIRAVAKVGMDKLTDTLRRELPASLGLDDPPYARLLAAQMQAHATMTDDQLRPIIEAQIARDAVMADRAADFLRSDAGTSRTLVVLCGAGHVSYGLGTAQRLHERLPDLSARIVILCAGDEVPDPGPAGRPITIRRDLLTGLGRPVGDYLNVIPIE